MPRRGPPEYLSVPVRLIHHGITYPELAGDYLHQQQCIYINRQPYTFSIFYMPLPATRRNLNMAVLTALRGRVFYGDIIVFRVSPRSPSRLVNLRAGHRPFALCAVEECVFVLVPVYLFADREIRFLDSVEASQTRTAPLVSSSAYGQERHDMSYSLPPLHSTPSIRA